MKNGVYWMVLCTEILKYVNKFDLKDITLIKFLIKTYIMALVTVQRSPSVGSSPPSSEPGSGGHLDDEDGNRSKSLSECYFAGKGAALVLPPNERVRPSRRVSSSGCDIQQHLQSMFYLLRPEETLKMAVKLESVHAGRTRYLVVVSCMGRQDAEECCLLGIDCNEKTTVGLVLRVLADTTITLDGDGGFSVCVCGQQHIFKPVSVQAMWSALQTLHKVSSKAREQNYFLGGLTHDWVSYYEQRVESDRSCLNEWHAMDSIESRRPPSPDSVRTKPREREETERVIRCTLKEIMMSVDLDEVTSKHIRGRLEEDLDMDLGEFKSFIDQEMLTILGQMDAATEIFDHVYLGSEWNASNHEELVKNGVRHILNVTREIDNFFPGMFNYLNVRVYDDEKTDLLKHWDDTFKYITRARSEGSKVLVHCKMGVSRSASVVIAYAMKAFSWDFKQAYEYVKQKRSCIKPNQNFMCQLETYQGILDAMKNKEKLQRSKSETNLKCRIGGIAVCGGAGGTSGAGINGQCKRGQNHQQLSSTVNNNSLLNCDWIEQSGSELSRLGGGRPKSWSPDNNTASVLFASNDVTGPTSVSMEHLVAECDSQQQVCPNCRTKTNQDELPCSLCYQVKTHNLNVRLPCGNGQIYSVSPNKIVFLPGTTTSTTTTPSTLVTESTSGVNNGSGTVRHLVNELESQTSFKKVQEESQKKSETVQQQVTQPQADRKGLVLNLTSQFEGSSKSASPTDDIDQQQDVKISSPPLLTAVLVREEVWDPGEEQVPVTNNNNSSSSKNKKEKDPFSDKLDRVFEREERKQHRNTVVPVVSTGTPALPAVPAVPTTEHNNSSSSPGATDNTQSRDSPSRQSSWSSYDSAVVLGYQGETRGEAPSRQSSWGSGDLRATTLPSRNSSWGSYDMRPPMQYVNERGEREIVDENGSSGMFPYDKEDIPWYPGTVKRTKQKLEENTTTSVPVEEDQQQQQQQQPAKTEISSCNIKLHGPRPYQTPTHVVQTVSINNNNNNSESGSDSQLSVSAPETFSPCVINTTQCPSVRQQKKVLENLTCLPKRCASVDESVLNNDNNVTIIDGKSVPGLVKNLKKEFEAKSVNNENDKLNTIRKSSQDDLSVKILVGKYEYDKSKCKNKNIIQPPTPPHRKSSLESQQRRNKHSSLLIQNLKNNDKVLPSANMVVASVVAKASSKKQQQGKTHPLAQLTLKTRHNNPVYNTM